MRLFCSRLVPSLVHLQSQPFFWSAIQLVPATNLLVGFFPLHMQIQVAMHGADCKQNVHFLMLQCKYISQIANRCIANRWHSEHNANHNAKEPQCIGRTMQSTLHCTHACIAHTMHEADCKQNVHLLHAAMQIYLPNTYNATHKCVSNGLQCSQFALPMHSSS